jgi:glycosyltransferase involved in cell wall biosynthesis
LSWLSRGRSAICARSKWQPHFSVIVPAHNAAGTIQRCVGSVLQQSFPDFEILVVDDASSDDTSAMVREIADDRVVLVRNDDNQGPSRSRNLALERATGRFVVFLDADDWLDLEFLEAARKVFAADDELDYLVVRYRMVTEQKVLIDRQSYSGGDALSAFLEDRIVSAVWSKVFRKRVIDEFMVRSPDLPLESGLLPGFEDSAFNVAFLKHSGRTMLLDKPLYNYEKRNLSATTRPFDRDAVRTLEKSHALVLEALGGNARDYPMELHAREFRMMAVNGISRLASDLRRGFDVREMQRWYERHLRTRFPLRRSLLNPLLKPREKALYLLFQLSPRLAMTLLAILQR